MAGNFPQKRLQLPVHARGFVRLGKVGHQGDAGHPGQAFARATMRGMLGERKAQSVHAAVELEKDLKWAAGRLSLQPVELRGMVAAPATDQFGAGRDFVRAEQPFEQQDGLLHPISRRLAASSSVSTAKPSAAASARRARDSPWP